jgi:ubiquinone/menaquinone biosynthesis C-methylase UbiE
MAQGSAINIRFRLDPPMTNTTPPGQPHYEFSDKYDHAHAKQYLDKHHQGIGSRLITWREIDTARKALVAAGRPRSVLDLPCGTGRFWEMLSEEPDRKLYIADNSQAMIDVGLQNRPPAVTARIVKALQCSAFATGLPDNFVDCVFSMRLLHHIDKSEDRILMLKEFARVSSATVIVSLWVDGNLGAWQRARLERKRAMTNVTRQRNRFVAAQRRVEAEFAAAGLSIVTAIDFLKYIDKKRIYVLRVNQS